MNAPFSRLAFLATQIALLSVSAIARAQMPPALVNAERAKILEGVTLVPKTGSPGPVGIWGNIAFPILSAASGREGNELAVAAAAGYGKGRIILFGHNSYLDGGAGGDHAKLIENCVKWVGAKEKPRIGLKGVKAAGVFGGRGVKAEEMKDLKKTALNDYDVIVLNAQGITDEKEGEEIVEWIKKGGGLIAGMTGWAFSQTSGGKDLATSHGLNLALMTTGVAFTDMSAFDQLRSFEARADLPRMMNAYEAITAIKKQREGGPALTAAEIQQGANAIQVAMAAQPPGRNNLQSAVMAALGDAGPKQELPMEKKPLTQTANASARIRLGMETRVLRLTATETVAPHPAAEYFPGKVPDKAVRVTQEVKVDPSIPGWTSTGLYAAAGETIQVTVPAAVADKGFAVRIGCHSDTLYHLDEWKRAPDITKSVALATAETKTASAFGGLIYIEVPGRAAGADTFSATVKGGVPAPLFMLGKDDDAKWNGEIKKRPAPWAELACDKMIVTCPTEVAHTINNPTQLMQFWKAVVEAQDDVTNQTAERKRPERIVSDVQISAGYMHSGYPIMVPTSAAPEMVTFTRLKFPGWGFYHEIGHNHQRGDFTFDGTGEVTNNVIGMYCYEAVLKKDWLMGHPGITEDARKDHIKKIKASSAKFATWKSDPFLALTLYIQLVQEFGWESWRKYLYSFADDSFGPAPKTDDEKRDQFLVRYSKIANKNLGPLFDAWGIIVTSSAKTEAAKFGDWMPKGMK